MTVEGARGGGPNRFHWARRLGGSGDFQRHSFNRAVVTETGLKDQEVSVERVKTACQLLF